MYVVKAFEEAQEAYKKVIAYTLTYGVNPDFNIKELQELIEAYGTAKYLEGSADAEYDADSLASMEE